MGCSYTYEDSLRVVRRLLLLHSCYDGRGRTSVDEFQRLTATPTQPTSQLATQASDLDTQVSGTCDSTSSSSSQYINRDSNPEPRSYQGRALTVAPLMRWRGRESDPQTLRVQTVCATNCATTPCVPVPEGLRASLTVHTLA